MHGLFKWSSKWWPGVIPLVVFWAIAAWTSTTPLESDLAARSTSALADTVLDKTKVAVFGRDVVGFGGVGRHRGQLGRGERSRDEYGRLGQRGWRRL